MNILLCSSLLQTKYTTLEKTKSYRRWIFLVGSLGPALAALFKPSSAPCVVRTGWFLVGLGDGPGCKTLAGAGGIFCSLVASAVACEGKWPCSHVEPNSAPWVGSGGNSLFSGSFSAHLVRATCSLMGQRSATGGKGGVGAQT